MYSARLNVHCVTFGELHILNLNLEVILSLGNTEFVDPTVYVSLLLFM